MYLHFPLVAKEFSTEKVNTINMGHSFYICVEHIATYYRHLLEGGSVAVLLFGSNTNIVIMEMGNKS